MTVTWDHGDDEMTVICDASFGGSYVLNYTVLETERFEAWDADRAGFRYPKISFRLFAPQDPETGRYSEIKLAQQPGVEWKNRGSSVLSLTQPEDLFLLERMLRAARQVLEEKLGTYPPGFDPSP